MKKKECKSWKSECTGFQGVISYSDQKFKTLCQKDIINMGCCIKIKDPPLIGRCLTSYRQNKGEEKDQALHSKCSILAELGTEASKHI